MPPASWILVAFAAMLVLYGVAVGALLLAGRGTDARALAGFVPDCVVLGRRLIADDRVPRRRKALLLVLVAYLAMPFDLVPDVIPIVGQADDLIVLALVLRAVLRGAPAGLLEEHWPGPERSLEVVRRVTFGAGHPRPARISTSDSP
jgi:uncharacterized membrane protein YkvA (DUF1232 family)